MKTYWCPAGCGKKVRCVTNTAKGFWNKNYWCALCKRQYVRGEVT